MPGAHDLEGGGCPPGAVVQGQVSGVPMSGLGRSMRSLAENTAV